LEEIEAGSGDKYDGHPELGLYGGTGLFGVQLEQRVITLKEYYAVVPVLDIAAAYFNYDTWGTKSDEWTLAYRYQGAIGVAAGLAIAQAFTGTSKNLLKYT